jgi:hypothetical protein
VRVHDTVLTPRQAAVRRRRQITLVGAWLAAGVVGASLSEVLVGSHLRLLATASLLAILAAVLSTWSP